jgi:protein O-mannosyl-transferase
MDKKYKYLIVILLIVVSLIAFGRILGNDFINFDDDVYITKNNHIKSGINNESIKWAFTAVVCANWHPLTLLSHAIDCSLFKEHAGGHHFISLLLHIGSVLLLFLFLNKTTKSLWLSAFMAAIFALHPLRVESVAWAAERKDVLSMFFGLATLYAYAYYTEKPQLSQYFLCLILFALGLMAKPMLVTLPFVLLLLDYWPLWRWQKALKQEITPVINNKALTKEKSGRREVSAKPENAISTHQSRRRMIGHLLWEKAPFIFLALISSIITIWAQNKGGALISIQKIDFAERVVNAVISYVAYLGKIFWPVDLAVFYPYSHSFPFWQVSGAAVILFVISFVTFYLRKRAPFFLVGWFWYLGTLVPVIGLVQVGAQAMADRYTYLPSIGIGIMLVWGIAYLLPQEKMRKIIVIPAAAIVLTVLTALTWQQCGYWKNSIALYEHALQSTNNNDLAYNNLGNALAAEGRIAESVNNYRAAIKIDPNKADTYYNLAIVLDKQGKGDEAITNYREALRIYPDYLSAHINLGISLVRQLKYNEALYHFRQALRLDPDDPRTYFVLSVALSSTGKIEEAIENLRKAVYLNPDFEEARQALRLLVVKEQKRKS